MRELGEVLDEVLAEVQRAETLWPAWPKDLIYQGALVAEEAGECLKACNQHVHEGRSRDRIREEAVHTAAMALRLLKNLP